MKAIAAKRPALVAALMLACLPGSMLAGNTSVNKSISIEAGQPAGRISSVNGNVRIQDSVQATSVANVNGNIEMGANVSVDSIDNVNGGIAADKSLDVSGEVSNVNGNIDFSDNTVVGGELNTVNGDLTCASGSFAKGLSTVNGDIRLGSVKVRGQVQTVWGDIVLNGASIDGGIRVIKPQQSNFWNWKQPSPPRIILGVGTQINAEILLEQPAQIYAHQSVVLPAIVGQMSAPVIRFNGSAPN
jgi:DUF4097 and DUF4098 domain-containing protein YvlB